jgi:hypothetical protein
MSVISTYQNNIANLPAYRLNNAKLRLLLLNTVSLEHLEATVIHEETK